jgi:hypothetical protein
MGRRLAKREEMDVLRRPSKRPPRFTRDVRASMGMLKRDMMPVRGVVAWGAGGVLVGGRKGCCWASRSALGFMSVADSAWARIIAERRGL